MVTYKKNGASKKNTKKMLYSGGPRDRQAKLAENERNKDIESLRKDLDSITTNMSASSVGYSKEKIESMVNDAIEETTIELERKYVNEINSLKEDLDSKNKSIEELNATITKLNDKLDKKDDTILDLTNKISNIPNKLSVSNQNNLDAEEENVPEPERPSIDKVFIDPSQKGSEDRYESHVINKEEESTKPSVTESLTRLKDIVGNKKIT